MIHLLMNGKKNALAFCLLFLVQFAYSQSPEIQTNLPTILPPSPTVASLMKFEEVPVNNYTGIPDISLPIYSFPTHSKDLTVNISLNYHPSSIAVDEVASYVGLGWNLMAGGTISRTVKGLPDDLVDSAVEGRHGIYDPLNRYYESMENITGSMDSLMEKNFSNFLWDVHVEGRSDSEHDLYQYNFMGHTGRFYIKKDTFGVYNVVKLDNDNSLLIEYSHTDKTFVIYDEKGLKYVFDEKEITVNGTGIFNTYYYSVQESNIGNGYTYNSAFHLTKIYDTNNQLLVKFNMNSLPMRENNHLVTTTTSRVEEAIIKAVDTIIPETIIDGALLKDYLASDDEESLKRTMPLTSITSQTRSTLTKKIDTIEIMDVAKIYFENISGRQDTALNSDAYRLNSITIKDWNEVELRKFNLVHSYSEILEKRMMLSELIESNNGLSKSYQFSYNEPYDYFVYTSQIGKDYWGFFNKRPEFYPATTYRETDPIYCKADVLQKIVYPTGGCVVFDFESNTYSHIGDHPVTNFYENPENYTTTQQTLNFVTVNGTSSNQFLTIPDAQRSIVSFVPTSSLVSGQPGIFKLFKVVLAPENGFVKDIGCGTINGTCMTEGVILGPGTYYVKLVGFDVTEAYTGTLQVFYKDVVSNLKQYLYGGGVRIKQIGYFDIEVPTEYFDLINNPNYNNENFPVKLRKYDYRFFGQTSKTSGSLSFPKPIFKYSRTKESFLTFNQLYHGGGVHPKFEVDLKCTLYTTFNNLLHIRTHGSDVGYQNVTVYEEGNGKTEYTYTSPINYPEEDYTITFPFLPSSNKDFLRGHLVQTIAYDNSLRKMNKQWNEYEFITDQKTTGLIIYPLENYCRFLYMFSYFGSYYSFLKGCPPNADALTLCAYSNACDPILNFMGYYNFYEKFGWSQLKESTSTDFFYTGGIETSLSTVTEYEYNAINKKLSSKIVHTAENDEIKTDYTYDFSNSAYTKNRMGEISQINSYKNGESIGVNKIVYTTGIGGNTAYLPQFIQSAKGSQPTETRLKFNDYDEFGNILEVQQENGTKISYIWGYNKTQPVAKIENMAYASIPSSLITAIQGASSESSLQTALNALRTHTSLANAMVTTYTYKPLIGVSTVTDPKGYMTQYFYDALGRLSSVKDQDGKILTTNNYNYRPQN